MGFIIEYAFCQIILTLKNCKVMPHDTSSPILDFEAQFKLVYIIVRFDHVGRHLLWNGTCARLSNANDRQFASKKPS